MKFLRILPVILFLILSYFLYWKITHIKEAKELSSALIDKKLPNLDLEYLEGKFFLGDILGKKPFIINYFASWCAPCRLEHKVLTKYSKDIIVVGVAYKDSKQNIKTFLEELGNPYSILLLDEKGRAAINLGLYGVPETYFINIDGKIKYRQVGPLTEEKFENIMILLDK